MSQYDDEKIIREAVDIMLSDSGFNKYPWEKCIRSEYYGVGRMSWQELFVTDGRLRLLRNDLTAESEHYVENAFANLRKESGLAVPWNAIVLVADRESRSGLLHRYYGSAAEMWDGLGGDGERTREEAARLLKLRESTETFGASEFALDLSAAIDAVADYIRENRVDVDAEALLAARFDGGWRVYVPEEPSDDPLEARLGRVYFLVSDDGRVGEVTSAIPPAVAIEDFLAQGR
ncbi:MAG: hypothetical protein WAV90_16210 [Gordonia amarae]